MKVVITQPTYLPWLGYFELVAQADVFVFLDTVQFERQSWQSRNKIRSSDGRIHWLSVPVIAAPLDTLIKDIELALKLAKEALAKNPNYVNYDYRKEQLWGEKLQNSTEILLQNEQLQKDVILAKSKIYSSF